MKIEIWSDITCPFCYIGEHRLKQAIAKLPQANDIELIYKSFELHPDAAKTIDKDIHQVIADKYQLSYEHAQSMNADIARQGAELGLNFQFDTLIPTNSFDAHRLIQFAQTKGKMNEMAERLFKAYFEESLNISDHQVLASLANDVGLEATAVQDVLTSDSFGVNVRADEQASGLYGITGVPFFVFDRKLAVSGAQPVATFMDALAQTLPVQPEIPVLNTDTAGTCDADHCTF